MRRKRKDPDQRLDELLKLAKGLPEEQRRNLADFLETLLKAHGLLELLKNR